MKPPAVEAGDEQNDIHSAYWDAPACLQVTVAEQRERERHALCRRGFDACLQCLASEAIQRADRGEALSLVNVDPATAQFISAFEEAEKAVRAERERVDRNAAYILADRLVRGRWHVASQ